ncbi:GGDEF domain-containing protein [Marinagarivorans cellulosilyticus]|uniref:diguanylate cyclase n=1 Tax=Marinagarivorans cellulosilyticus TaxID=2721545 RepID=A0AAN1WFJ2_9GAMM|nr:GGDEF domain-containing protein [Marinagarivorans cellulosilyticus]BCD96672.1 hypothetical protein MARGE09_P0872 [Marinagarivorans cellulosilyticus]
MRLDINNKKFLRGYRKVSYILLAATAILFIGHYFLPLKRLVLLPAGQVSTSLYGYTDRDLGITGYWQDQAAQKWACDYKKTDPYGCGWSLQLNTEADPSGENFNDFDALEISLDYSGPATRLRIYVRNYNPAYLSVENSGSTKVMSMTLPVGDALKPLHVKFDEFDVAWWWLRERKANWHETQLEFDSVTDIGVDLVEPGEHRVQIDQVAVVGRWVKTEALLTIVIGFWMSVFLLEGVVRFYQLYRIAQRNRENIRQVEEKQRMLAEENKQLETIANTDPLTGIYNRAGLKGRLDALQKTEGLSGLGVLLMDIDHFKHLNDQYGHDLGDKVLKTFASLLSMNLREQDILARLGGEEFVVVLGSQSPEGIKFVAEKLRRLALQCTFNGDSQRHISVSIGVTSMALNEEFSTALKRADNALYQAKQNGRNCVEYESG